MQGIAIDERVLMMWKKYSDGVPNVLIDKTNILSEKATNVLLDFPNVASQDVVDNILVLWIRKGWTFVWMFSTHHKFVLDIN